MSILSISRPGQAAGYSATNGIAQGAVRAGQAAAPPSALCLSTRPYQAERVLPVFTRLGITTIERPHGPDSTRLLGRLAPALAVLVVDPRRQFDLALISMVASATRGRVLAVTPEVTPAAHADALDAGAHASLPDSTDPVLFGATIRSLLRTAQAGEPNPPAAAPLRCCDLLVDMDRREVLSGGERVPLTATEFRILSVLAQRPGVVVDAADVMSEATGLTYTPSEARSNLKVYVRRIRRKLEAAPPSGAEIVCSRGFGYMLKPLAGRAMEWARAA